MLSGFFTALINTLGSRRLVAATLAVAAVATLSTSVTGCKNAGSEPVVTINDGIVVTRAEYNELFTRMVKQANLDPKDLVTAPKDWQQAQLAEQIKQYTLNKLIFTALVRDAAEKAEIKVTPEEYNAFRKEQVDAIGGEASLDAMLKQREVTEASFEESLREQLMVQKFVDEYLTKHENVKVDVSDKEAEQFYNGQKPLFYRTEGVNASHILLKAVPQEIAAEALKQSPNLSQKEVMAKVEAKQAEKKAEAEKLLAEVQRDPKQFESLAKAHSEDPMSQVRGGKLDTLYEPMTDAQFWAATKKAKPGVIVPNLVQSAFGYHILLVHDRVPAHQQPFAEVKNDIIRVLKQQRRQQALMAWVTEQRKSIKLDFAEGYEPQKPGAAAAGPGAANGPQPGGAMPVGPMAGQ